MKWGILGTGKIAQDFATAVSSLPGLFVFLNVDVSIVAVGSRNQSSSDQFAARFKINASYGSYSALAAAAEPEIIYVSAIHTLHKEAAIMCMKNKKHVLCEKPVTMNAKEVSYCFVILSWRK